MEQWIGMYNNHIKTSYHYGNNNQTCGKSLRNDEIAEYPTGNNEINFNADFHIWTMIWDNDSLTFYIDNKEYGSVNSNDATMPYEPVYIIFNSAVCGASYCNGTYPYVTDMIGYLQIDYIKIYKQG